MSELLTISVYLKRDTHDNGMTMEEYAQAVMSGTQPVLDHDAFVYQFGTTDDYIKVVTDWATAKNLTVVNSHAGKASMEISGTAEQFNNLFNITIETVTVDNYTYTTHSGEITIPSDIDDVVEMILGLDNAPIFQHHAVEYDETIHNNVSDPNTYPNKVAVTPQQVATAYGLPSGTGAGQAVGVLELTYSGYVTGWNSTDVNNSFSRIGLSSPTVTNVLVGGATSSTTSDGETMLDIFCAGGVAPGATVVVYTAANSGSGFVNAVLAVANDTTYNPGSLGISWGSSTEGSDYLNSAFQACVVKGIICFTATGDSGANNLVVGYPQTNAYQVAAGGTSLYLNSNNTWNNEAAWTGSGGGISTLISRPSWQAGLTSQTVTNTGTYGSPTALPKRGIPDISAPADPATGYVFYLNGSLVQYGGTSAAAPFLAGAVARLLQLGTGRRISNFNTVFYSTTSAFTDITLGNNLNSNANGYTATTGWDAATGLGSPNATFAQLFTQPSTFPKFNYNSRPTSGQVYPRRTTGAR